MFYLISSEDRDGVLYIMVRYLFKSGAQDSAHRKHLINGGSSAIQDWLKDLGLQPLGFSKSLMLLFITILSI